MNVAVALRVVTVLCTAMLAGCALWTARGPEPCPRCDAIERRVAAIEAGKKEPAGGETLLSPFTLARFYRERNFRPAWSSDGVPSTAGRDLGTAVRRADLEGLNPDEYHRKAIAAFGVWRSTDPVVLDADRGAEWDVLMTDAFLTYAAQLAAGRTNLSMIRAQWALLKQKTDPVLVLEEALVTGDVMGSLARLSPPHRGYERLKSALERYRRLAQMEPPGRSPGQQNSSAFDSGFGETSAGGSVVPSRRSPFAPSPTGRTTGTQRRRMGGWPFLPPGPEIKRGDRGRRVSALRRRLSFEDLTRLGEDESDVFDADLDRRLRRFQERHGLDVDGRLGPETLRALNVPIEERIHQIKFNMDRWRWLPNDLGERHVIVNIPAFMLTAYENGAEVFSLPVIVGTENDGTATPVFSDKITYLEFSPVWNVPRRIAAQEMLERIQSDPGYLKRNHLEVVLGPDDDAVTIPSAWIDWCEVTPNEFPFRLRQAPGPWNALGPVKFMFPNQYNVYIHGNATPGLFDRRLRTFSHGCVRVDDPTRLAQFVLRDPDWTRERIAQYMRQPKPVTVPLGNPVPVYLWYGTAWVDDGEELHFRQDIYGRDREMKRRFYPSPGDERARKN